MYRRAMACTVLIIFTAAATFPTYQSANATEFLVAEWGGNVISRLADLNGDGDALDAGERAIWADAVNGPTAISYGDDALFVLDSGIQVLRFVDLNLDGDALDLGEWTVFADGFSSPANIHRTSAGITYVSEPHTGEVWQLKDLNGDGDALDVSERTLFAVDVFGADDIISFQDSVLVSTNIGNQVHHVIDLNGDGDALDLGEDLPIAGLLSGGIGGARGLNNDGDGGFFVTSAVDGTVSHARDLNRDGDMLDIDELTLFAETSFGILNAPGALAKFNGAMLATDADQDTLLMIADLNGDGDALDLGEVVTFADGTTPVDVIALPVNLPGDYNADGTVDAADYVVFRKHEGTTMALPNDPIGGTIGPAQYAQWTAHFGQSAGSGGSVSTAASLAVPEPASVILVPFPALCFVILSRNRVAAKNRC